MATVADKFVATLKASGVRRIYGIPGDSLNGFKVATNLSATVAIGDCSSCSRALLRLGDCRGRR